MILPVGRCRASAFSAAPRSCCLREWLRHSAFVHSGDGARVGVGLLAAPRAVFLFLLGQIMPAFSSVFYGVWSCHVNVSSCGLALETTWLYGVQPFPLSLV